MKTNDIATIKEEKKRLRHFVLEAEKKLSPEYKKNSSEAICEKLLSLPEYLSAKTVFAFVSLDREIDTGAFLKDVLASGKRLCVPLCVGKGLMELREIKSFSDLEKGYCGILEPKKSCLLVSSFEVDFALIPCVSCDLCGRRLGNGGGYYDRFLAGFTKPSVLICMEKLLSEKIPEESFDKRVPIVVTEKGVFGKALEP